MNKQTEEAITAMVKNHRRFKEVTRPMIISNDWEKRQYDVYLEDFDLHRPGPGCPCKPTEHMPMFDPGGMVGYYHKEWKQLSFNFDA